VSLNTNVAANPCGLIAKNMFTDTYKLQATSGAVVPISEKDIAHGADINYRFKNAEKNHEQIQWMDVEDEHVMVWYQMETFPSFVKLWGHLESDL
jgi:hypothetical protein